MSRLANNLASSQLAPTPRDAAFVTYTAVPRLEPGSREAAEHLDREGFCVYKEVLAAAEVAHTLDLIWSFLEAQGTGVRRGEPATWADDDWSPSGGNPGLHSAYGLAQCEAAWYVRGKPRVQEVWAGCFGVRRDELITSFDGVSLLRPSGVNASWAVGAGNFHIDGRRNEGGFD